MFWKDTDYVGDENPHAVARRRGTDCIQTGLLSHAAGTLVIAIVRRTDVFALWFAVIMIVLGTVVLCVGCARRARSKGYGPASALLGLFGFPGVLVLAILPDRTRHRAGFEVVMPLNVSTTWMPPDEDPKWMPRSWGEETLHRS